MKDRCPSTMSCVNRQVHHCEERAEHEGDHRGFHGGCKSEAFWKNEPIRRPEVRTARHGGRSCKEEVMKKYRVSYEEAGEKRTTEVRAEGVDDAFFMVHARIQKSPNGRVTAVEEIPWD